VRDVERVGDVPAVRPGLHQAGCEERRGPHRRPVPGDSSVAVEASGGFEEVAASDSPAAQQLDRIERPGRFEGDEVEIGRRVGRVGQERLQVDGERLWIAGGHGGRPVEVPEVPDLVTDGPALALRRAVPDLAADVGDQIIEGGVLSGEVADHLGQFVAATWHGRPPFENDLRSTGNLDPSSLPP
jgi:hypothetical protein